jgi:predicted outer membrane protein
MGFLNRAMGRRRGGRLGRRGELVFLGVAVVASAAALFVVLSPPGTPADGGTVAGVSGTVQTRWGPLSDQDRELITKVRQAGLWEAPSGQQAQQRAASRRVKEIGGNIATEHLKLDEDVRQVAEQLGVVLPSEPSREQQQWMAELSARSGDAYDRHFVFRLRAAHGKVFAVIAAVRANTQNSLVRDFSARANAAVLRHMTYLESTGLVDYSTLS